MIKENELVRNPHRFFYNEKEKVSMRQFLEETRKGFFTHLISKVKKS